MKIRKTTVWVTGSCKVVDIKPPSKRYRLVGVTWKRKKQRSSLDGSKCVYTRITAYWTKE